MSNTYYKYEKYQKYINGVPQDEYKQGELIGTGEYSSLKDCESGAIYKWTDSGETVCAGYKLCVKEVKQKSTDGGQTWTNTNETRPGEVIDSWSTECGAVIKYAWRPTGNIRCHNYSKEEEYVYQVSYTMGTTWQDVEPRRTKWEITEVFSDDCFTEAQPFTFTFDAGDEGAELELNTKVDSLYSYWTEDDPSYSSDTGRYSIKYYADVYTKYAIDWGDGAGPQLYDKTTWDSASDTWSRLEQKPESSLFNTMLKNPMSISNYIYRTGGIKTIKIWGNISYFGCRQVKDFIHWGVPMFNVRINTEPDDLLALLKKKGIKVNGWDDRSLTGAKIEGYNNFEKVETSFQSKGFGTMYSMTFKNLKYFDMSNSPNCTYPNPFSSFNHGRLTTFLADNCTGMIDGPNLSYLGDNDNSSKLTKVSFKNCTSLIRGPKLEMNTTKSSGGALTVGLNLGTDGVFENCPNIEELAFGYAVYVNSAAFRHHPKLEKITGILEADATTNNRFQFYQMCKGMTSLNDIENLTLKGCGFEEAFMDCPKIRYVCTTVIANSISNDNSARLTRMYSNTRIGTLDISKIYQNTYNPYYLYCDSMFFNCLELTTITGSLQDNQQTSKNTWYSNMFNGCSKLTTISPIFKNKTALPDMSYMFYNCDIRTLPNDLFNRTYEESEVNIPHQMFANNVHLTNYPIDNLIPMWKLPPFFFGDITEAKTFFNCPPILSELPSEWGGYYKIIPAKIKVETTMDNEIVQIPDPNTEYTDNVSIMVSESGTHLSNGRFQFEVPGTYDVDLYPFDYNENIRLPKQTVSITDWGETYDLNSKANLGALYETKVTYLPYGNNLFSKYTNIIVSPNELGVPWYQTTTITDVADNLLQNCAGVTVINGTDGLGAFNMDLTEEKYTAILSRLTNLQRITRIFKKKITSTCGIFKNNPSLTNVADAFASQYLVTVDPDEFSNCKELTNIGGVFGNCIELTNIPHCRENKKINNFRLAFAGCTNLKGSTPVDENGLKLWQRGGQPGYPFNGVDGFACFRGCTGLDDYNEIPDWWKGIY